MQSISLRKSVKGDLDIFFNNQLDEEAGYMAAFTAKDPTDKEAYMAKWTKLLSDETVNNQTILLDGAIAGSASTYEMFGETQVTYWISKEYWGQGIATKALAELLKITAKRPLFERAAFDNIASKKVMEKCGFSMIATDRGFSNARNQEIEELVFRLDS